MTSVSGSLRFFSSSFSFTWFFMCLNRFVVLPLYLRQVAAVSFPAWKYNHTVLLFLSDILRLRLCVAYMLLAEPASYFAWRCWVVRRYNIQSQEGGGGAKCACSTLWGAALESSGCRQPGHHVNETAAVHTGETLKLKYRSHYTGITWYQYQRWYQYYRYLDRSAHPYLPYLLHVMEYCLMLFYQWNQYWLVCKLANKQAERLFIFSGWSNSLCL